MGGLDSEFVEALALFEPFGIGNPRPVFSEKAGALPFERIAGKSHLRCYRGRGLNVTAFNFLEHLELLNSDATKLLFYNAEKEIFNNREYVKVFVRDVQMLSAGKSGFLSYAEKFGRAPLYRKRGEAYEPDGSFGRVLVCFSPATFNRLAGENPGFKKAYGVISSPNPVNTILFAPSYYADLGYFGRIEVFDDPPRPYADYLKNSYYADIMIDEEQPRFENIPSTNVELLREHYKFFRSNLSGENYRDGVYEILKNKGYSGPKDAILLSYYIFSELGLIETDRSGMIYVGNFKTDINASLLFRYAVENAGNNPKTENDI